MGKVITFGEIMLRLMPEDGHRLLQNEHLEATFGGGEANVAVSLANYGMDAAFVTVLPQNPVGQAAINALRYFGVDTSRILRQGDSGPLRSSMTGSIPPSPRRPGAIWTGMRSSTAPPGSISPASRPPSRPLCAAPVWMPARRPSGWASPSAATSTTARTYGALRRPMRP